MSSIRRNRTRNSTVALAHPPLARTHASKGTERHGHAQAADRRARARARGGRGSRASAALATEEQRCHAALAPRRVLSRCEGSYRIALHCIALPRAVRTSTEPAPSPTAACGPAPCPPRTCSAHARAAVCARARVSAASVSVRACVRAGVCRAHRCDSPHAPHSHARAHRRTHVNGRTGARAHEDAHAQTRADTRRHARTHLVSVTHEMRDR